MALGSRYTSVSGRPRVVAGGGVPLILEYQKTKFRRSQIVSRPEGLPCGYAQHRQK